MTEHYTLPQFSENLSMAEEINKSLIQLSLSVAERNAEYSRNMNQELVDGFGKVVSDFHNPELLSQAMVSIVSTSSGATANYLKNSLELIQKVQKETIDIFMGDIKVEATPEVEIIEKPKPKVPTRKVKKTLKEEPAA